MDGSGVFSRIWTQPSHSNGQPQNTKSKDKGRLILVTPSDAASAVFDEDDDDLVPPKPPPKDFGYSPYSSSLAPRSQSSLLPPKSQPNTPHTVSSRWQNLASHALEVSHKIGAAVHGVSPASSQTSLVPPTPNSPPVGSSSQTKSKFRLPKLKRRLSTSRTTGSGSSWPGEDDQTTSMTSEAEVSAPWGFYVRQIDCLH